MGLCSRAWSSTMIKYCKWVFIIIKLADCNLYRWLTDSLLFLVLFFPLFIYFNCGELYIEIKKLKLSFSKGMLFLIYLMCNRLTTLISLWTPSKILDSLRQILKLSLRESSIQTAIASWGLSGVLWLGVTSMTGGDRKGWKQSKGDIS